MYGDAFVLTRGNFARALAVMGPGDGTQLFEDADLGVLGDRIAIVRFLDLHDECKAIPGESSR